MMKKTPPLEKVLSNRGFTFIELLIVSVVILVLVSFSTPLFRRSFTDLELNDTVSTITKFIGLAQERAVIDGAVYRILFDFEDNTYQLSRLAGEGQNIKYENLKDRFGRVSHVPKSIEMEGSVKEILFYPDGRCDIVEIKLTNRNKKRVIITTTGQLGNVVIKK